MYWTDIRDERICRAQMPGRGSIPGIYGTRSSAWLYVVFHHISNTEKRVENTKRSRVFFDEL